MRHMPRGRTSAVRAALAAALVAAVLWSSPTAARAEQAGAKPPAGIGAVLEAKPPETPAAPAAAPPPAAPAPKVETDPKKKGLVTNMFFDTSVRQALADVAAQTGVIIVPDASVRGVVTCELKDVPLEKALEILLAGGGYLYKKMDGYWLVGAADSKSPTFSTFSVSRSIRLNYLKAEDAKKLVPEPFAEYVTANKETHDVCVTASEAVAERILNDLKALDRPPRQVMLDARVVEISSSAQDELGINWTWEWQAPTPGANTRAGAAAYDNVTSHVSLAYATTAEFTRSLLLTLRLLCENHAATIIANPRVAAMDSQKAEISVNTEEYFQIITGPTNYPYTTLQAVQAGIILKMTPRIGTNGDITLEVSPEVSDVVGTGAAGLPRITRRKATTTVRVADGGTVVIGGLAEATTQDVNRKVPILGDLPGVGYFFKTTDDRTRTRDILIFITPRLLDERAERDPTATARAAPPPRPAVRPAGEEFRKQLREALARSAKVGP